MFGKFRPARGNHAKATEPVTDLDAIIAEPVSFRYQGKVHKLNPMRLDEFLRFTNAQARLMEYLQVEGKTLTPRQLAEQYHEVIGSVCSTLSVDDIMGMEQVQVAALYQLVIDLVTGQVKTPNDPQKKSRQKIPLYEYAQQSSSPSAPESSGGPSTEH